MKTTHQAFWTLALVSLAMLAPQNAYAVSAMAQQISGEVLVAKASAPETWAPITADTALATGDSVKTNAGSCSIVYSDQATFTMQANTTLTLEDRTDAQNINLLLGKIVGKVNHDKATQPFVVTTPAAVATVRGTQVDFTFNEKGELIVDLDDGNIQAVNEDAEMTIDLGGNKSITIYYDKEANVIRIKNECSSDGVVKFSVLGTEYSENPCDEKEISLSTAEPGSDVPDTDENPDDLDNPDEGRRATDQL